MLILHEVFTPQKYVHSSTGGVQRAGTPSTGSIPQLGGLGESGGSGAKPPKKNFLVKVYCNFIVNLDHSL
jgi:hypothetical protein